MPSDRHIEALQAVLRILEEPRLMPRRRKRGPMIECIRELIEAGIGDGERDDGGGDLRAEETREGA
jgi:hypothetical protein